ncbi:hypothetical protein O6H91_13G060600 [Diphasiastrum complanatum]|uniref:Uncharacterized protein n=1 Tax=Diphasiastrum complanatum TaxID=34168 RepID=A0ACC2BVD0_DIPCM|nr:hypothetical protein O6H91_13G060600 [Diphasiastrum complanatum]
MALRAMAAQAATVLRLSSQPRIAKPLIIPLSLRYSTVPEDLKYSASHEWVKVEGDTATIGITDHAAHELGDVVFADLPESGTSVHKGKPFAVVESVKAASDVYSPVSGEVIDFNEVVKSTPATVNKGPFVEGWLIKVKLLDKSELESLLDAAKYREHIESSGH